MRVLGRKRIGRLVFGLFVALGCGCKRDIAPPIVKCATDFVTHNLKNCSFTSTQINGRDYASPTSNPNNGNEFAVVEDGRLIKFNIATSEKTVLVEGLDRLLTPDWGASGWIVFSAGWKIWKVNENGSGLEQITFGPREIWLEFNPAGDRIVYPRNMDLGFEYDQNPSLRDLNKMIVISLHGNPIDSFCRFFDENLCHPWEYCSWSKEDEIAAEYRPNSDKRGIAIYDLNGQIKSIPYSFEKPKRKGEPFITDIEWHPTNGRIYFQDTRGLHWLDPSKEKTKRLRTSCADEFYEDFTITSDGEYIIAIRGEATADKDACTITEERYVVRMKTDGGKEERIFIPPW